MDSTWEAEGLFLVDHHGDGFHLDEAHGKVAILTFLYTSYADAYPFTGAKLCEVSKQLGAEAEEIDMVAISVDPVRTPGSAVWPIIFKMLSSS